MSEGLHPEQIKALDKISNYKGADMPERELDGKACRTQAGGGKEMREDGLSRRRSPSVGWSLNNPGPFFAPRQWAGAPCGL